MSYVYRNRYVYNFTCAADVVSYLNLIYNIKFETKTKSFLYKNNREKDNVLCLMYIVTVIFYNFTCTADVVS